MGSFTRRTGVQPRGSSLAAFAGGEFLESLESRTLYAADFVSVGMRFETYGFGNVDGAVFMSEAYVDDDFNTDGDVYTSASYDRTRVDTLPYSSIEQIADGRYRRHPDRGSFGSPFESNGARFLDDDGFPVGWWYGDFGGGDKEAEFIVQRPDSASYSDFYGTWRFTMLSQEVDGEDFDAGYGTLQIDANNVRFFRDAGTVPHTTSPVDAVTDRGRLTTDAGEYFYLNADKSVLIFADMAEYDGKVSIGVAVRQQPTLSSSELIGSYLLEWGFTDSLASDGPNDEVDFRQRVLSLEADGDYRIWDLDDYDSGKDENQYAISRGFWRLSGDRLILDRDNSSDVVTMAVSPNGSTLLGLSFDDGHTFDSVFGVATRAYPNGPPPVAPTPVISVPAVDSFGRPAVYALGSDDVWEVVDLIREAGGPNLNGRLSSWVDPKDDRAYAAGASASGLILYSQPTSGNWSYRNLTTEISGAQAVVGNVQTMTSPEGLLNIVGLNQAGQLVRYHQTGAVDESTGEYRWFFSNIETTDLEPGGQQTPAFEGDLAAYSTSWGGLNVAGVDGDGRVWSVWWAPGQARWTVTDLSAASGVGVIAGGLSVYVTPWNGINIAGIDAAGDLQVTWWVPSFGGNWAHNNLTAETSGPRLRVDSITSYVSSWGGLNIAGFDASTGEVQVYWWAPERSSIGWAVTSLSASVAPSTPRITTGPLIGFAARDQSLNVFGYDGTTFIRFSWRPSGAQWQSENLTSIAVDR